MSSLMVSYGGNFYQDFDIPWGDQRAKIFSGGQLLSLSLDKTSGSGFISKKEYLFGRIDMQLNLVAGNSAGTVTAYYLFSQGPTHDEIDFEFLGNLSGDPYIVHTSNVFTQGKGNREQQFYLWFDPTRNFHTYSIVWTSQQIIFLVDNTPIRVFKNGESIGVPFPKNQPMKIYSSLWNADDWATRGGPVKADYCGGDDPDLKEETEKQFVDLLTEEMKLQETVNEEHAHHMNITFAEARRVASQYQREAEKCNAATETCAQRGSHAYRAPLDARRQTGAPVKALTCLAIMSGTPFYDLGSPFDGTPFYGLGTPFDDTPFEGAGTPFEGTTFYRSDKTL
ncbi:hypothetical protein TEA_010391 [Camellia sinensis var. sinensis]|uniref:GH16 domain-containing protein n=1 Tax=Camellia sinensis var. sinensis TaxID=542762 RepID=A0A4S4DWN5_CAMSN|nr:hypothetical protein TEA_010391 [Camellia sinensis var. sinensis]